MDEAGHWVKFVVVRTEVTPQRPHGLRCSLTLHAPDGERLVGFDNAHPVRERRGPGTRRGRAIDLYYPFWSLLVDEFDLVVYDLRNHGWNTVGAISSHNVPTLIQDHGRILESIDRNYGNKPKIGIMHSVSALVALLSTSAAKIFPAFSQSSSFSAQVLFDPPLCMPGASEAEFDAVAERLAEAIRRRGCRFDTLEDFVELLLYTPIFTHTVPGVLELAARTTLRESADGKDYILRCPREYEARIIEFLRGFCPLVDFDRLPCPTKVVGSDPTLPNSFLPTIDLSLVVSVDYDFLPDTTHLLQLEKPSECVAEVRQFLDRFGVL